MKNKKNLLISLFLILAVVIIFILTTENTLEAYLVHKDSLSQKFYSTDISVEIIELNQDINQIFKPKKKKKKCPIVSNTSDVDIYIRTQVFVPIEKINYIDDDDNIIFPTDDIDLILFEYNLGQGWEKVTEEGFSGVVQDKEGNKFRVYTYKFTENDKEKTIKARDKIDIPVFEKYIEGNSIFKIICGEDIKVQDLKIDNSSYIVFCWNKKDYYHMIPIIDNVIYDKNFDCMNLYVISIYKKMKYVKILDFY